MNRLIQRVWLVLVLLGMFLPLMAQEGVSTPPPSGAPTPDNIGSTPPPLGPSTPAPATGGTTALPPSLPGTIPVSITAQRELFSETLGMFQFFGNVTLTTPSIRIHSDELSYSDQTGLAFARGNVSIRAEDGNTYWGDVLEYNVGTRQWRFLDFSVQYPPELIGSPVIAPVYVNGQELSGLPNGVRASNAHVTTCDLTPPHYELVSRRVDIYPGDKLIARDNDFYVLGHRILHIPWFFLSLKQHQSPIVPDAGFNSVEGYYLRLLYQYVLSPGQLGGIRLDLTQKLGIGVGVDHFYTSPGGSGEAFAYVRQGFKEYALRVDHTQALPGQFALAVHADNRKNSLFTLQPTTMTYITTTLTRKTDHTSAVLNTTRRLVAGSFGTDNITANLRYTSSVAAGNLSTSAEYSSFGSTPNSGITTPANQQLWNRLLWARSMDFATVNLRLDKHTDLNHDVTSDQFVSGVERLPEVYFTSTDKSLHLNFLKAAPSQFTMGWGVFNELPNKTMLDRYRLEWQSSLAPLKLGHTTLTGTTGFRQTVYGDTDTTALYAYNGNLKAVTKFGEVTHGLEYRRENSRGFTPFRFDTVYPNNDISDTLQLLTHNVQATIAVGRDLQQKRWHDFTFRSAAQLTPTVSMSQSLAYDLNAGKWHDLVSQYSWVQDPRLVFNIGSRYDLDANRLTRISTELDWVVDSKTRLEWLGGYDGLTHSFLYNDFLITRDLHCWDASLYYSSSQKYFYLYVRLKALNLPLPRFGIGRGGQVLNTDQGTAQ